MCSNSLFLKTLILYCKSENILKNNITKSTVSLALQKYKNFSLDARSGMGKGHGIILVLHSSLVISVVCYGSDSAPGSENLEFPF